MATARRTRVTKQQKRYKRCTVAKDFAIMVKLASEVVMQNRGCQYRTGNPEYVLFEFPHWVTFESSFPKGHIVSKTLETNIYKINAVKLLDWLYNKGHSSYDSSELVKMTRAFELLDKSVERMFDVEGE